MRSAPGVMRHFVLSFLLLSTVVLSLPAQIRASEQGSMTQLIDGTRLSVQYSRPRVRGRSPLFGEKVVRWGEVWTPGANWATTLETNKEFSLDGHRIPVGKYSVWFVVRERGEWTLVLDPKWKLFHENPPDSNGTQIRFPVRPQDGAFTEALTWTVPDYQASGGTLQMNWGTTRVSMKIGVDPSLQTTLAEAEAQPYLGRYEYTESTGGTTKTSTFTVLYENGTLKGEWDPADPYFRRMALIRIAPDWFSPGVYDKHGEIYEVLRPDLVFEFTRANGRAMTFDVRNDSDKIEATGKRKP